MSPVQVDVISGSLCKQSLKGVFGSPKEKKKGRVVFENLGDWRGLVDLEMKASA